MSDHIIDFYLVSLMMPYTYTWQYVQHFKHPVTTKMFISELQLVF